MKRDEARKLVESLGGQTTDSITAKVNLLVIGKDAGSKADKAKEKGIKVITEQTFRKLAGI